MIAKATRETTDYSKANSLDVRRLACSVIITQVKAATDAAEETPLLGLPYLTAWFQSDGKGWLEAAGMGYLTRMPAEELARIAFENGPRLFGGTRCNQCSFCRGNGRRVCVMGNWERDYAISTVKNSPHSRFRGCGDFKRNE